MEDKNLSRLNKATKVEVPELNEDIITNATAKKTKPNLVRFTSVAAAAALALTFGIGQLTPKQPLIQLADQAQGAKSTVQGGLEGNKMAGDSYMMAIFDYSAAENLSKEMQNGHIYQIEVAGTASSIVRKVAAAIGLDGKETYEAEWDTATISGSELRDGYAIETLTAQGGGTGSWYYWNAIEAGINNDPAGVPVTDAEAKAAAAKLFTATGFEVSPADIVVSRDDYGLSANAELKVNGMGSGLTWSMHWNGNGTVDSIYGNSVKLVDRGEFDTVSASESVSRINKFGYWASVSTTFSSNTGTGRDFNEPQPKVEIDNATLTNGVIYDAKGNAWIVPAFALSSKTNGFVGGVIALVDGIIEIPEAPEVMPMDTEVSNR